jgi:hypothetical protein
MSNHVHVVVRMVPDAVAGWSDEEVVRRWWRLFPGRGRLLADGSALDPTAEQVTAQARNGAWVAARRARLRDLSWFMKSLKEPISRRANAEDGCTGAFWEERFTSVPLLDQAALIACMAYVDLNPIRAKQADRPERSAHTGVRQRIRARQRHRVGVRANKLPAAQQAAVLARAGMVAAPAHAEEGLWVTPLARCVVEERERVVRGGRPLPPPGELELASPRGLPPGLPSTGELVSCKAFSVHDYLTLVDATGRLLRAGKRGAIPPELAPILARLDLSVEDWLATLLGWRSMIGGALGHYASRLAEATRRGVAWVRNRCPLFAAKPEARTAAA